MKVEDELLIDTTETSTETIATGWFSTFEADSGGEVTSENRAFEDDNNSNTHDYGFGLHARLEQNGKVRSLVCLC